MPPNTASAERRQKRLRRLRAEKEDLLAALRTSRLRVKQLEAARVLFATPTAEVDVADLSLSAASSPSESGHVQPPCCPLPKVPVGAQSLSQCRELRQVMQSHQETLEQEGFMWQAILDQQEEDGKQIRERVAEAEEMHDQMEARVQGLMDLMVALLSPASAPEGQEELLSSKYLAMVEDLDFHQDRVEAKVSSLHAALEVERSENCCRALQLCDQQRRTTRLHDDLCRLQGHLFHTRQGNRKQEPPTVAHRTGEFFLPDAVTHELPKDGYLDVSVHALPSVATPATVTPVTECSAGMEAQEDPDGGNPTDTNFPDTASPEPLSPAAPAVTPSLPEERESRAERAQIEAAMRDVLEEVAFDHLVVRCNGFYEFGKMARACLRLSDGVLTASVDGVIYEPFEEFLSKLQEPAASLRAARREDCPKAPSTEASQVAAPREAEPRKPPPSPGSSAGPERGSGRAEAAANGTRGGAPAKLSRGASPSQGRRLKVDRRGSAAAEKAAPTSGHVPSSSSRPSQVAGATRAQQPRPKTGTPRAGSKENTTSKPTGASRGGDLPCSKVDKRGSLASTPPRAKAGNSTAGGSDGTPLSRATSSAAGSGIVGTGPGGTTSAAVPVPLLSPGSELRGELRSPGGYPSPCIRMAGVSPPRAIVAEGTPQTTRALTPQTRAGPRSFIPSPMLATPRQVASPATAPFPLGLASAPGFAVPRPLRQEGLQTIPVAQVPGLHPRIVVTPRRHREGVVAPLPPQDPASQSWRSPPQLVATARAPGATEPHAIRHIQVPQLPFTYVSPPVPRGRAASASPPRLAQPTLTPVLGTR